MVAKALSKCGRFVVLDGLHLDRHVFEALSRWAAARGIHVQDALQLAVCAFNESLGDAQGPNVAGPSVPRGAGALR